MSNNINNFNTNNASDKRRKSIFGFSIKLKPFSNELLRVKRHNSVSFATNRDNEALETEETSIESERNDKQNTQSFRSSGNSPSLNYNRKEIEIEENETDNQRNNNSNSTCYTQSFRPGKNSHHNTGSVQNLVIRRQRAAATKHSSPSFSPLARRPSVPTSSPLSIVNRLRKSFSTTSLDEETDSAFCSAESSPACSIISSSIESSPIKNNIESTAKAFQWKWTEQQNLDIEEDLEDHCMHSFSHKLVNNQKLAYSYLSKRNLNRQIEMDLNNNNVLCAQGNVQFHLLEMIAPSNKRIVNIGSPNIISTNNTNHWFHLSPSLRPYLMSNLELNI